MRVSNAGERARVALCVLGLFALTGCGGGAPTRQLAEQSSNPQASPSAVNAAPVISGTPGTALQAGQTYSFQPAASDANGDTLSFSVSNLPLWAAFNSSIGRLSGTPPADAVGIYGAITISVSDGKSTASLPAFQILVTSMPSSNSPPPPLQLPEWPGGTGSATVRWTPPTANSDGTSLTDLAGYQIRFGSNTGAVGYVINVDNPSVNAYVVENLPSGSWYFAVVAVNASGATSSLSSIVGKQIG